MDRHRLDGIDEKLKRADEQFEQLGMEWKRFLREERPYEVETHYDAKPSYRAYVPHLIRRKPIPLRFSVIVGDIAHNLRSALDHLAAEVITAHGGRPSGQCAFPIVSTEREWIRRVEWPKPRCPTCGRESISPLKGLSRLSDAWAYIKAAQPYQGGKPLESHPLFALSDLSNRDKHRVIHASYVYPAVSSVSDLFTFDMNAEFIAGELRHSPGDALKERTELALLIFAPTGPDPNVRVKRQVEFDIAFGDPKQQGGGGRGGSVEDIRAFVGRIVADCRVWTG